jgi:hypothetical protein
VTVSGCCGPSRAVLLPDDALSCERLQQRTTVCINLWVYQLHGSLKDAAVPDLQPEAIQKACTAMSGAASMHSAKSAALQCAAHLLRVVQHSGVLADAADAICGGQLLHLARRHLQGVGIPVRA